MSEWQLTQEEDRYSARRSLAIAAGVMLVIAATLVLVGWLLADRRPQGGPAVRTEQLRGTAPREIGGVEQTLATERYGLSRLADEERALQSYGWVDRERGVVSIPIDEAMRLVAGGQRP